MSLSADLRDRRRREVDARSELILAGVWPPAIDLVENGERLTFRIAGDDGAVEVSPTGAGTWTYAGAERPVTAQELARTLGVDRRS